MRSLARHIKIIAFASLVILCIGFSACKVGPDLTLDRSVPIPFTIDWTTKEAVAHVVNRGTAAGEFLVYLEISRRTSLPSARPESQA